MAATLLTMYEPYILKRKTLSFSPLLSWKVCDNGRFILPTLYCTLSNNIILVCHLLYILFALQSW